MSDSNNITRLPERTTPPPRPPALNNNVPGPRHRAKRRSTFRLNSNGHFMAGWICGTLTTTLLVWMLTELDKLVAL